MYTEYIKQKYPFIQLDDDIVYAAIDHYAKYIKYLQNTTLSDNIGIQIQKSVQPITNSIQKLISPLIQPAVKGQTAEHLVEIWCQNAFPDSIVSTTSKNPRSADFMLEYQKINILIEVKCYTSTVPTKEVIKFKRDLSESNSKFGIFLSVGQRISKIARFNIENHDNKYIIYIPNATIESFTWSVLICKELNYICTGDNDICINTIVETLIQYINSMQIHIDDIKKNLIRMEKQISNIRRCITNIKNSTNSYISTIVNKHKK